MVTHLQIEPTTRCNFTCGFCCGRRMEQNDLAFETFERALADFPELVQLELQGEGEPLMHPRFFDMLRLARQRNIAVSFITNGSFFSETAVAQILQLGVEKISVSLESADAETFRDIRGGKLEKVVRGIELLWAQRKARGLERPVVGFSVTVLQRTQSHLAGILDLYERLGLDGGITMQPLQRMDAYTGTYDDAMRAQILDDAQVDRVWVDFRSNKRLRKIHKTRRSDAGFHDHLMAGWGPSKKCCPWLDRGLYVDRNGVASACCMVKEERYALGRVGGREAILQKREEMRAQLARGEIPAPCSGCELARFSVMSKLGLVKFALAGVKSRFSSRSLPIQP